MSWMIFSGDFTILNPKKWLLTPVDFFSSKISIWELKRILCASLKRVLIRSFCIRIKHVINSYIPIVNNVPYQVRNDLWYFFYIKKRSQLVKTNRLTNKVDNLIPQNLFHVKRPQLSFTKKLYPKLHVPKVEALYLRSSAVHLRLLTPPIRELDQNEELLKINYKKLF